MPPDELIEQHAREAAIRVASVATALLVNHRVGELPTDWGSGTLLKTASGGVAILSAWHVLEGRASTLVHIEDYSPPYPDAITRRLKGPGDVGLAVIRPDVADRVVRRCLDSALLGASVDCRTDRRALVVGFSEQMRGDAQLAPGVRQARFGCMHYWTQVKGIDRRAYSLGFDKAKPTTEIQIAPGVCLEKETMFALRKPRGISGGGMYIFLPQPESGLWSVPGRMRLVGVLHEFAKRSQRAVPAFTWRDWLDQTLETL